MKLMVVSHERSGTHFLIDSIATNFQKYEAAAENRCDLDGPVMFCDPEEMDAALKYTPAGTSLHDRDIPCIWKSHHPRDFFEPVMDYLLSQYRVLYIARDGRDVMTSLWHHAWHAPPMRYPLRHSVGVFMQEYPCGYLCERYHRAEIPQNFVQRWNDHVESWMGDMLPGIMYVTYADLKHDYEDTIRRIAEHIGNEPNRKIETPPLGGVTPWRGISGNWQNFFNEGDSAFFWYFGWNAMQILGIDDDRADRESDRIYEAAAAGIPW